MRDQFRKLYTQQKSNAKQRDIEFLLTLDEWKTLWLESGHWEARGRGIGRYCMCRVKDVGPYASGNVFIALNEKNISDGNIGKKDSVETRAKKSAALKGRTHAWSVGENNPMHRSEVKAKLSAAISGGKHYKARMVGTPHGVWPSAVDCAKALSMPVPTVNWRCKNNRLGFAYLT